MCDIAVYQNYNRHIIIPGEADENITYQRSQTDDLSTIWNMPGAISQSGVGASGILTPTADPFNFSALLDHPLVITEGVEDKVAESKADDKAADTPTADTPTADTPTPPQEAPKDNTLLIVWIFIACLVVALLVGGGYVWYRRSQRGIQLNIPGTNTEYTEQPTAEPFSDD